MTTARDPWMHPLERARQVLTLRLQQLERALPHEEKDRLAWEGWEEYVRVCDLVVRLIACLSEPVAPITRRDLAERFKTRAG